ncbi:MAG: rhodanese-like domain-containing protein [Elusimicrobiota bacterium]
MMMRTETGIRTTLAGLLLLAACAAALAAEEPKAEKPAAGVPAISADNVRAAMLDPEDDTLALIDVRAPAAFVTRRIEGAVNIPYTVIRDAELPDKELLVLYCPGGTCRLSEDTAEALWKAGRKNVRVLEGGLTEWVKRGYPLVSGPADAPKGFEQEKVPRISPMKLRERLEAGEVRVLDSRPWRHFKAGHLPGALNVPLEEIQARLHKFSYTEPWVVYDRLPDRGRKAARMLKDEGFDVIELSGGLAVWGSLGYPVEVGAGVEDSLDVN